MARWEPNAVERMQGAALELFAEKGYADTTVADIADRAGLTKRTFFNHFTDKREVLFAGGAAFEAGIVDHVVSAAADVGPIDAAIAALAHAGAEMERYGEYALARRDLITSSIDLQERNLVKLAALAQAIAAALVARQVPARVAGFAAEAAVSVFTAAYDEWAVDTAASFASLMETAFADLREAVGSAPAA